VIQRILPFVAALPPGRTTLVLAAGMVVACWWPFHAPLNAVSWGKGDRGAVLRSPGVLLSTQPLAILPLQGTDTTIELWLRPEGEKRKDNDRGTILSFYSADGARQLKIDQYHAGMDLRWEDGTDFYAPDAMNRGKYSSITITSDASGTRVYANGKLVRSVSEFHITNKTLSRNVAVGTSAETPNKWIGEIRAFAIYNRVLARPTIWTEQTRPDPDGLQLFYMFEKPAGATIANLASGGDGLRIPERYEIPAKAVLAPLDFRHPYDLVENIVGFVPFGFFLCGFLESRRVRNAILFVAIVSSVFSVTIELVQVGLPTRDSSLTDVLTNFLGGTIGAWLWLRIVGTAKPAGV